MNNNLRYFLLLFFCYSCQRNNSKNETSLSKKDTIAIIETALADSALNAILLESFPGKDLKLVSNEFVLSNDEINFRGKPILIVSYDSTLHNPTFYPIPARFYGEVFSFKTHPSQQITVYLLFRGTGLTADFKIKKLNNKWQVINRVFGKM